MHRRALLATTAAALTGGCLGAGGPATSRLAWIRLSNERPQRYEVDLTVEDDGATAFSDAYPLAPADPEPTDIRVTAPVSGPGQYVVRAVVDGRTLTVDTTTHVDASGDCLGVGFSLLDDGSVESTTATGAECE